MKSVIAIALVLTTAGTASAHDFWLAAMPVHTRPGSTINLTVNVGEEFPAPDAYVQPDRVEWMRLLGPDRKTIDVTPQYRRDGEALLTPVALPAAPGTYVASVRLSPRFIELGPKEFTAYLKDEGLARIVTERERLGETAKPGRERYSRWPKALIRTGDGDVSHVTTPTGVTAEIVPATDPTRARLGESVSFQLRFEGKPVAGAQINAIASGPGGFAQRVTRAVSDADGRVRFTLDKPGLYFVGTTHMVRRGGEAGPEAADWESYWVSLTFAAAEGTNSR